MAMNTGNNRKFDDSQGEEVKASGQSASYAGKGQDQADAAIKSAGSKKSAAAFKTISEVADELDVQQHVLRFWETKFSYVKPLKRGGGRRYYRPEDVSLLRAIHHLLYVEGYTIKGVQKLFREVGKKQIVMSFGSEGSSDEKRVAVTAKGSVLSESKGEKGGFLKRNDRLCFQISIYIC